MENYIISFNCIASCTFFLRRNCVNPSEVLERGETYIKVSADFMRQANWIGSHYVLQIIKEN